MDFISLFLSAIARRRRVGPLIRLHSVFRWITRRFLHQSRTDLSVSRLSPLEGLFIVTWAKALTVGSITVANAFFPIHFHLYFPVPMILTVPLPKTRILRGYLWVIFLVPARASPPSSRNSVFFAFSGPCTICTLSYFPPHSSPLIIPTNEYCTPKHLCPPCGDVVEIICFGLCVQLNQRFYLSVPSIFRVSPPMIL